MGVRDASDGVEAVEQCVRFPCGVIMYDDLIKTTQRDDGILTPLSSFSSRPLLKTLFVLGIR